MPYDVAYDDLCAIVHIAHVPGGLAGEIDGLYSSLFSTLDYFATYDDMEPSGAVVLRSPRHVLLFAVVGDTIEVLNKTIAIAPADARRACRALFRALPDVRRIHLEVMFPPARLRLAKRVLYSSDDMVVALPGSMESYLESLGRSTRRNLRTYENRLRRSHPDVTTEVFEPGGRTTELFDLFMGWKRRRLAADGRTVYFDRFPDQEARFTELLRRRGEVHLTSIEGRAVSLVFAFPVGEASYIYQYAFDPDLAYFHLGLLSQYWVIADALARGMRRVNLLWGTNYYKERLGARPVRAARLSVFRSQAARLFSLGEAAEVGLLRLRRARGLYWQARHAVGIWVRAHSRWPSGRKP